MNNFNKFYEKSKIEEEIKAKKTKASWEDAKRGESLFWSEMPFYETAVLLILSKYSVFWLPL